MIPPELTAEICLHLTSLGYELISLPDPPNTGPAQAAIVVQKSGIGVLLFIALVDEKNPYFVTPNEQVEQYILQKYQGATRIEVILVDQPSRRITYPQLP